MIMCNCVMMSNMLLKWCNLDQLWEYIAYG